MQLGATGRQQVGLAVRAHRSKGSQEQITVLAQIQQEARGGQRAGDTGDMLHEKSATYPLSVTPGDGRMERGAVQQGERG